jgi:hypothetical protein
MSETRAYQTTIKFMVLRIPAIKYMEETFRLDIHTSLNSVYSKLEKDKNVIDYYRIQ